MGSNGRCVIAMTAEDDRYRHAREAGVRRAQRAGVPLVLYDIDAASLLNEPLPSGWAANGTAEQYGRRLTVDQLERVGRAPIARQVAEARDAGVEAYGWLPTSHGPDPLAEYAAEQGAQLVVMPAEREELDALSALLAGTPRPLDRLAEQAPAQVLVVDAEGNEEAR